MWKTTVKRFGALLGLLALWLLLASQVLPDADHLRLQEMNLWSRVEFSLQSTQNEIDGLKNLVESLETGWQKDSEKLTGELMLSREDYNKLQLLQENTANSFSALLTDYNTLKAQKQKLIITLVIAIGVLALLVINWLADLIFWIKKVKFLWFG